MLRLLNASNKKLNGSGYYNHDNNHHNRNRHNNRNDQRDAIIRRRRRIRGSCRNLWPRNARSRLRERP